jgi:hypothetical protein
MPLMMLLLQLFYVVSSIGMVNCLVHSMHALFHGRTVQLPCVCPRFHPTQQCRWYVVMLGVQVQPAVPVAALAAAACAAHTRHTKLPAGTLCLLCCSVLLCPNH